MRVDVIIFCLIAGRISVIISVVVVVVVGIGWFGIGILGRGGIW